MHWFRSLPTVSRSVRGNPQNKDNAAVTMLVRGFSPQRRPHEFLISAAKVTLDHSLWFYDHDFDCSEWILFVVSNHPVLGVQPLYNTMHRWTRLGWGWAAV